MSALFSCGHKRVAANIVVIKSGAEICRECKKKRALDYYYLRAGRAPKSWGQPCLLETVWGR